MRHAVGGQLLVEAVVAAVPRVGRVAGEPDVRWPVGRVHLQNGGVQSALLAGGVHRVERRPAAVHIVEVERAADARHDAESVGVPQPEPHCTLPAHSHPGDRDAGRPPGRHPRHDASQQVLLGRQFRVELRADAIDPPRPPGVRRDAGEFEPPQVIGEFGGDVAGLVVEVEQREADGATGVEDVGRLAADLGAGPAGEHGEYSAACGFAPRAKPRAAQASTSRTTWALGTSGTGRFVLSVSVVSRS